MKYFPLIWANLMRRKVRTIFTLLSVFIAFMLFAVLGAVDQAFTGGVQLADANRLVVTNKIGLINSMPINYADRIATVPGVGQITWQEWVGAYFQDPRQPITGFGVDENTFLGVHDDMNVPPDQAQAWIKDRQGVLIGESVAKHYGWKVGDRFPLRSNIWRDKQGNSTWDVVVDGIYHGGPGDELLMHYKYLDDTRAFRNNQVGMFMLKIASPDKAAPIGEQVDQMFANSDAETKTSTEKAFVQGFAAMLGNIGKIVTGIVTAVLFSMLLVIANTMAQSIRERVSELAVLKALGFSRRGVGFMVLAESLLVTALGGVLGLLLGAGMANGIGSKLPFVQDFHTPPATMAFGILLMVTLGLLAGLLPAAQAMRLQVAAALRRA
ncbi:MAG TPA: ABC transporter permease [Gammaproteobacteria bacterium]|jgi:putative ABC transport system permease protein|nr:ABC transporter permease [Gammaproteobacteria bacterium]